MQKRRAYPDSLKVNDYFELHIEDIWKEIKEMQRAIKLGAIIALIVVLINSRILEKLRKKICTS